MSETLNIPKHLKTALHVALGLGAIAVVFGLLHLGGAIFTGLLLGLAGLAIWVAFSFVLSTVEVTWELLTDKEYRERKDRFH